MADEYDVDILEEIFRKDNYDNTNWADVSGELKPHERLQFDNFIKGLFYCANCEQTIFNCELQNLMKAQEDPEDQANEDNINRTLVKANPCDHSLNQFIPLTVCLQCLELDQPFVLCTACTKDDYRCPLRHCSQQYKSLQPALLPIMQTLKFKCTFCGFKAEDDNEDSAHEPSIEFFSPNGLKAHLIEDCPAFKGRIRELRAFFNKPNLESCHNCGFLNFEDHVCKSKLLKNRHQLLPEIIFCDRH